MSNALIIRIPDSQNNLFPGEELRVNENYIMGYKDYVYKIVLEDKTLNILGEDLKDDMILQSPVGNIPILCIHTTCPCGCRTKEFQDLGRPLNEGEVIQRYEFKKEFAKNGFEWKWIVNILK